MLQAKYINFCLLCFLGCQSIAQYNAAREDYIKDYNEIYLCNGMFVMSYEDYAANPNRESNFIDARVTHVKTAYNFTSHKIIASSRERHSGLGFAARGSGVIEVRRYIAHFDGAKNRIPNLRPSISAYVYLTNDEHLARAAPFITGDYKGPAFLYGRERISYKHPDTGPAKSTMRLNLCRNDKLTVYEINTGSEMIVEDGKIRFIKGGAALCPAWPDRLENVHAYLENKEDECKAERIKEIE